MLYFLLLIIFVHAKHAFRQYLYFHDSFRLGIGNSFSGRNIFLFKFETLIPNLLFSDPFLVIVLPFRKTWCVLETQSRQRWIWCEVEVARWHKTKSYSKTDIPSKIISFLYLQTNEFVFHIFQFISMKRIFQLFQLRKQIIVYLLFNALCATYAF